ncbi:hypothetical protein TNIN_385141 [Trichonephila inaurata madagascariensis]|uniref:Uncharacterized protein n=1 Tax=Trichonephila inaurata madagascariensis TaxID=2747483 RepID=A0A8X6Y021_9ARAC|nr:hypothetical protein TNIN_385141 [Trichonephila inaurata madagascariensis]
MDVINMAANTVLQIQRSCQTLPNNLVPISEEKYSTTNNPANKTGIQLATHSEQQLHHFGEVVDLPRMKEILLIEPKMLTLGCMKLKLLQKMHLRKSIPVKFQLKSQYSCMHLKMPGNHCIKPNRVLQKRKS